MNIVVLVKQVPDTYSERKLNGSDGILDRDATDAVLDEINERAVEAALVLKEANDGSEVTVLTMGPDRATDSIRKALSMGADKAVHLSDDALAGTDYVGTAKALAKAIGTVEGWDVVIAGNEASDGRGGAVPAMVAELLGVPALTHAQEVSVEGSTVNVTRATDDGITKLTTELPAVVSVARRSTSRATPRSRGSWRRRRSPSRRSRSPTPASTRPRSAWPTRCRW
jgi:electron transfer flavoprotein beta subunit